MAQRSDKADTHLISGIKESADCREIFRRFWPNHFRQRGNSLCPFHEDSKPSLQISKSLAYCHSEKKGWDAFDLFQAGANTNFPDALRMLAQELGLNSFNGNGKRPQAKAQIVGTYDYVDRDGNLLFQVVRFEPKDFRQRRPDGESGWIWNLEGVERVIYRMPEVLQSREVYICEGEKDVDGLAALGLTATTSPQGAGKWLSKFCRPFDGVEKVVILPDNDPPGREHALDIAKKLYDSRVIRGQNIKIIELPGLPPKGDVSDWLTAGGTAKELDRLAREASKWEPKREDAEKSAGTTEKSAQDDLCQALDELNRRHAVTMVGGKCLILNEVVDPIYHRPDITLSSLSDFKNQYSNRTLLVPNEKGIPKLVNIGKAWLESPNRRSYNGIVFSPGGEIPGFFNLFRGFAINPRPGKWDLMRNHIFDVICSGNDEHDRYLINWCADLLQRPGGERAGVSIVLRGGRGVGKGVFVNSLGRIIGAYYRQINNQSQLVGRFNMHLKDCLLLFCDEGFWAGDKSGEGVL